MTEVICGDITFDLVNYNNELSAGDFDEFVQGVEFLARQGQIQDLFSGVSVANSGALTITVNIGTTVTILNGYGAETAYTTTGSEGNVQLSSAAINILVGSANPDSIDNTNVWNLDHTAAVPVNALNAFGNEIGDLYNMMNPNSPTFGYQVGVDEQDNRQSIQIENLVRASLGEKLRYDGVHDDNLYDPEDPFDNDNNPNNGHGPQHSPMPTAPEFYVPPVSDWMENLIDVWGDVMSHGSPLVLDLSANGDGISLSSITGDPVYWDIRSEGVKHACGWVSGDTGLLAIDLNNNGIIDDNSELFGDVPPNGTLGSDPYGNGFQALAVYDSNTDGVIDSDDDNWADLLVWTDDNHDGISQAEELHTLDDLLITSISLDFDYVNYDINGNTIKQASTFEIDGHTHDIADVWFAYNTVNTVVSGGYTLDLETLSLPFQRGYGLLPSLHIAMSIDGDLKDMVSDLASKTAADLFDSEYDLRGAITAIMYQWAGVQDVDPDSRSEDFPESELDARQLGFLEHVMGEPLWHDPEADPGGTVYPYICQAWNDAFSLVATNLLAQSGLWDVLGNPVYNLSTDTLTGGVFDDPSILRFVSPFTTVANTLGTDFNDIFVLQAGDSPVASAPLTIDESAHPNTGNAILFGGVDPGDVYLWTDTYGNMTVRFSETDEVYVTGGIDNSGVLILDYLQKVMFSDGTVWDFSNGLHLILPTNEFYAYGSAFGDTIEGSSASDQLYGYDGNDVLISHGGGDYLVGGAGNDTYVITGEGESITESAGTDTIIGMPDGAHVRTDAYGDLIFFDPSTGDAYATVYGTYSSTTGITVNVEHVTFEDSSTMDLTGGLTLYTTDQNGEYLFGTGYGDTLTAGGGYGDHLYGYGGADHLVAGDATAMTGGAGADTFVFSSMSTTATVSDFNDGDGDKIDIASILSGYFDPEMDDAEDFVAIVESSGGSLVQVDLDGAGTGYSMATVATLSGVTGLDDVATLVSNGTLIVSHA